MFLKKLFSSSEAPPVTTDPEDPDQRPVFITHTRESQRSIDSWARETFGDLTPLEVANRMALEFDELLEALRSGTDPVKAAEECADVYVMLVQVIERLGFDLLARADEKMAVNRKRRWRRLKNGQVQHVEDKVKSKLGVVITCELRKLFQGSKATTRAHVVKVEPDDDFPSTVPEKEVDFSFSKQIRPDRWYVISEEPLQLAKNMSFLHSLAAVDWLLCTYPQLRREDITVHHGFNETEPCWNKVNLVLGKSYLEALLVKP